MEAATAEEPEEATAEEQGEATAEEMEMGGVMEAVEGREVLADL